jgi:hypothetical protein
MMVVPASTADLASCPRSPTHFTFRSWMILKMCVIGRLLRPVFFSDGGMQMYEGFATKEMLQKRWRKDAEYEVRYFKPISSVGSPHPHFIGLLT